LRKDGVLPRNFRVPRATETISQDSHSLAILKKSKMIEIYTTLDPVLDCFLRGLPHHFRNFDAPAGTTILIEIVDDSGGQWWLSKGPCAWHLAGNHCGEVASRVTIPQALAWRLFTKGLDRDSARAQIQMQGNRELAERVLDLTAIVG
jgi:hypothetical protein